MNIAGSYKAIVAMIVAGVGDYLLSNADQISAWVAAAVLGLVTGAATWLKANAS